MACPPSFTGTGMSSRRSYDTDSITLRRMFAYDPLTNQPPSTGYVLTSLTKGVVAFTSVISSLSTVGYAELPAEISTVAGDLLSAINVFFQFLPSTPQIFLPSTVTGLASSGYVSSLQLMSTVEGLGSAGYISSAVVNIPITSTVIGLGTVGYISSSQLQSTVEGLGAIGYLSSLALISTVAGLGSAGYVSTSQLTSTSVGLASIGYISSSQLFSTVAGLGSASYLSSSQLVSTVEGLGSAKYISSSQLASTVQGLGTSGYLSTVTILRSTYSNIDPGNWSNVAYLYSNFTAGCNWTTIQFDLGASARGLIKPDITKLDIECKPNLQFGYYDTTSRDYVFNTLLQGGTTSNSTRVIGTESLTYYILNANLSNLPFFFQEKNRFLITSPSTLSSIRDDAAYNTLCLHHNLGVNTPPATNQFFATPASTACVTVVLDNTSRR